MSELLSLLLSLSVLVFAVSSMLSAGLGRRLADVVGPLREPVSVLRVVVANYILVPAFAIAAIRLLPPPTPLAVGLFLVATAAGAPFLIKLTAAADSNVGLSTTLLVLLLPMTIVVMPFVVPIAVPEAEVSVVAIARPLVLSMLLPLAVGLLIREFRPKWALSAQAVLAPISTISLVMLMALTVVTNLPGIRLTFETTGIVLALVIVAGAFFIGYLMGGPDIERREVLALGTGQRNISAATVVATQALNDPNVVTMVVVASLAGFVVLFPAAWFLRRRPGEREPVLGRGPRKPRRV